MQALAFTGSVYFACPQIQIVSTLAVLSQLFELPL